MKLISWFFTAIVIIILSMLIGKIIPSIGGIVTLIGLLIIVVSFFKNIVKG